MRIGCKMSPKKDQILWLYFLIPGFLLVSALPVPNFDEIDAVTKPCDPSPVLSCIETHLGHWANYGAKALEDLKGAIMKLPAQAGDGLVDIPSLSFSLDEWSRSSMGDIKLQEGCKLVDGHKVKKCIFKNLLTCDNLVTDVTTNLINDLMVQLHKYCHVDCNNLMDEIGSVEDCDSYFPNDTVDHLHMNTYIDKFAMCQMFYNGLQRLSNITTECPYIKERILAKVVSLQDVNETCIAFENRYFYSGSPLGEGYHYPENLSEICQADLRSCLEPKLGFLGEIIESLFAIYDWQAMYNPEYEPEYEYNSGSGHFEKRRSRSIRLDPAGKVKRERLRFKRQLITAKPGLSPTTSDPLNGVNLTQACRILESEDITCEAGENACAANEGILENAIQTLAVWIYPLCNSDCQMMNSEFSVLEGCQDRALQAIADFDYDTAGLCTAVLESMRCMNRTATSTKCPLIRRFALDMNSEFMEMASTCQDALYLLNQMNIDYSYYETENGGFVNVENPDSGTFPEWQDYLYGPDLSDHDLDRIANGWYTDQDDSHENRNPIKDLVDYDNYNQDMINNILGDGFHQSGDSDKQYSPFIPNDHNFDHTADVLPPIFGNPNGNNYPPVFPPFNGQGQNGMPPMPGQSRGHGSSPPVFQPPNFGNQNGNNLVPGFPPFNDQGQQGDVLGNMMQGLPMSHPDYSNDFLGPDADFLNKPYFGQAMPPGNVFGGPLNERYPNSVLNDFIPNSQEALTPGSPSESGLEADNPVRLSEQERKYNSLFGKVFDAFGSVAGLVPSVGTSQEEHSDQDEHDSNNGLGNVIDQMLGLMHEEPSTDHGMQGRDSPDDTTGTQDHLGESLWGFSPRRKRSLHSRKKRGLIPGRRPGAGSKPGKTAKEFANLPEEGNLPTVPSKDDTPPTTTVTTIIPPDIDRECKIWFEEQNQLREEKRKADREKILNDLNKNHQSGGFFGSGNNQGPNPAMEDDAARPDFSGLNSEPPSQLCKAAYPEYFTLVCNPRKPVGPMNPCSTTAFPSTSQSTTSESTITTTVSTSIPTESSIAVEPTATELTTTMPTIPKASTTESSTTVERTSKESTKTTTELTTTEPSTTESTITEPSTTKTTITTEPSITEPSTTEPSTTKTTITTESTTTEPSTTESTTEPLTTESTTEPLTTESTTEPLTTESTTTESTTKTTELTTTKPSTTMEPTTESTAITTETTTTTIPTTTSEPTTESTAITTETTTTTKPSTTFEPTTMTSTTSGTSSNTHKEPGCKHHNEKWDNYVSCRQAFEDVYSKSSAISGELPENEKAGVCSAYKRYMTCHNENVLNCSVTENKRRQYYRANSSNWKVLGFIEKQCT